MWQVVHEILGKQRRASYLELGRDRRAAEGSQELVLLRGCGAETFQARERAKARRCGVTGPGDGGWQVGAGGQRQGCGRRGLLCVAKDFIFSGPR